jgi:two-component system response regulator HydG
MKSPRVLLVDDEAPLRLTLAANLELEGFVVTEAASAEDALMLVRNHGFDLVVSDIRMPGMNGVELFRELRRLRPKLPVVLMTAFALEELVEEALQTGAYTVLSKPFDVGNAIEVFWQAVRSPVVLVVDGQPQFAAHAATQLKKLGLRAEAVAGASQAFSFLSAGNVDLCVVDVLLGEQTGPELVAQLRALHPGLSIIAMSSDDAPGLVRQMASLGTQSFLKKPLSIPELVRSIAVARRTAPPT